MIAMLRTSLRTDREAALGRDVVSPGVPGASRGGAAVLMKGRQRYRPPVPDARSGREKPPFRERIVAGGAVCDSGEGGQATSDPFGAQARAGQELAPDCRTKALGDGAGLVGSPQAPLS